MAQDVASFARILREEGIEAAKAEADKITADARTRAESLVREAIAGQRKKQEEANREMDQMRQRVEAELQLVARDVVLQVKKRVEHLAMSLLQPSVKAVLSSPEVVKTCLVEVIKGQQAGQDWELSLGPTVGKQLSDEVVQRLFPQGEARVQMGEALREEGFSLRQTKEQMVIEVTPESVSAVFRRLLAPELEKYLQAKA